MVRAASAAPDRRGQPLWALAAVLLGWVALRAALIDWPAAGPGAVRGIATDINGLSFPPARRPTAGTVSRDEQKAKIDTFPGPARGLVDLGLRAPPGPEPLPLPPSISITARSAAGHNLLWMAAMRAIPLIPEVAAALTGQPPASAPPSSGFSLPGPGRSRWSADAWLAWHSGSHSKGPFGSVTPVYGASQAGALLRYDLAPASRNRPAAYIRGVGALAPVREQDLAVGLAARPIAGLPFTAHGEMRLSRRQGGTVLRPAAFVSGGLEDATLAAGVTARGYAQAGYVGGRDATAFADGSVIAEKPLWRDRGTTLTAGAGTWGGAQRGAARLDIGPSASLRFRLGEGIARLSADYRVRVAGNAEPAAGAALTLAAGF